MSLLEIKNLCKEFEGVTPLKNIDLTVEQGEVISIIGPSGTGKSTLLRCINRLETPTSGSIIIDGDDVCEKGTDLTAVRKKVGMVFQSFNLFGHKSIIENIIMPQMDLLGKSRNEARTEALLQLRRVGLEEKAYNMPDELSGGQKQRVAIARALAMHPQIMLYDEPTSALDPTMVTEVKNVIRHLAEDGMTMLVVTHEMRLVRDISTRVLYMDQGEIYEQGTPEEIFTSPKRELTRAFVLRITSWNWETSENGRDFIAMIASLEEFCRSRFMSRKMMNNCEMVFEEIYSNYFLPLFEKEKNSNAQFILEAQGENEKLTLTVITEGTETDPFSAEIDETAALILKSKAKRIGTDKKNIAMIEIKQN